MYGMVCMVWPPKKLTMSANNSNKYYVKIMFLSIKQSL